MWLCYVVQTWFGDIEYHLVALMQFIHDNGTFPFILIPFLQNQRTVDSGTLNNTPFSNFWIKFKALFYQLVRNLTLYSLTSEFRIIVSAGHLLLYLFLKYISAEILLSQGVWWMWISSLLNPQQGSNTWNSSLCNCKPSVKQNPGFCCLRFHATQTLL